MMFHPLMANDNSNNNYNCNTRHSRHRTTAPELRGDGEAARPFSFAAGPQYSEKNGVERSLVCHPFRAGNRALHFPDLTLLRRLRRLNPTETAELRECHTRFCIVIHRGQKIKFRRRKTQLKLKTKNGKCKTRIHAKWQWQI